MNAAKTSSTESVQLLLKKDPNNEDRTLADPNVVDGKGQTALDFALRTNNAEVINILAEVTTEASDTSIKMLAQSNVKVENNLENHVQKIWQSGKIRKLFEWSSFYGNPHVLDYLLNNPVLSWTERDIYTCIENVIKSDDPKACQVVQDYYQKNKIRVQKDFETLARSRGKSKILEIFKFSLPDDVEKQLQILHNIPKSEEFPYCEVMDKIAALVLEETEQTQSPEGIEISFQKLLKKLHVASVHYNKNDVKTCDDQCGQKMICSRIRDVINLLELILKEMSGKFPIFKDVSTIVVGSL